MRRSDSDSSEILRNRGTLVAGFIAAAIAVFVAAGVAGAAVQDLGSVVGGSKPPANPPKKSPSKKRKAPTRTDGRSVGGSTGSAPSKRRLACGTSKFESDAERNSFVEKSLSDGKRFVGEHDYRKAEQLLKQAVDGRCDARAFLALGGLYGAEQRWALAEDALKSALQIEPDNVDVLITLSNTLTRQASGLVSSAKFAEAERYARRAVFLNPKSADANQQLGEALETLGNISRETQAYYEQATRLAPNSASAFAHLSRILRRNGKIKESDRALATARTLATDAVSKFEVAEILQSFQWFSESEPMLREALESDPKNLVGTQLLARALVRLQKFDEAEQFFVRGVDSSPGSIVPLVSLGNFYIQRDRLDDSEKRLVQASTLAVAAERLSVARQFEILGDAFTRAGRDGDAARVFKQAKALKTPAAVRKR